MLERCQQICVTDGCLGEEKKKKTTPPPPPQSPENKKEKKTGLVQEIWNFLKYILYFGIVFIKVKALHYDLFFLIMLATCITWKLWKQKFIDYNSLTLVYFYPTFCNDYCCLV